MGIEQDEVHKPDVIDQTKDCNAKYSALWYSVLCIKVVNIIAFAYLLE